MTDTTIRRRHPAATAVGVLAVLGAVGSIVMTLAHIDLGIPVIAEFGPGRTILPAAIGFSFGALLFAAVAYGAFAERTWAWPLALVVNTLALASALMPWRGLERSGVPVLVTVVALVVLLSPAGRRGLLRRS